MEHSDIWAVPLIKTTLGQRLKLSLIKTDQERLNFSASNSAALPVLYGAINLVFSHLDCHRAATAD
jgi:hypothetical protein